MGVDISVGNPESDDYVSEKLGSYTSFLGWKHDIAEKIGIDLYNTKGPVPKLQLILNHSGGYKVEELTKLLEELDEIKKLNIEEFDTIICYNTEEVVDLDKMKISKGLKYKETQIIKSKDTVVDKFIRVCKIAIERRQPIKMS